MQEQNNLTIGNQVFSPDMRDGFNTTYLDQESDVQENSSQIGLNTSNSDSELEAPEAEAPEAESPEVDAPEVEAPEAIVADVDPEADLVDVTVTVENLSPENGTTLTPLWAGFHDGTFDTYDRGRPVSAGVESLAEDGDTSGLSREFIQSGLGAIDGTLLGEGGENPVEIDPGETTSLTFSIDPNAADSRFFNYASMILPTNDTWIANGVPDAHEIFDENGNFLGADITVTGEDALDAGTEVNDEAEATTAFFGQTTPNTGETEDGVVQEAEGFIEDGRVLGSPDFANADYTQPGFEFARISVTADVPEVDAPEVDAPEVDAPEVDAPGAPAIPEVAADSNFVALTENNVLATFNPDNLSDVQTVEVTGIEGDLVGIDTRPADGLIYGVSTENNVYTIDQNSGEATLVSTLDIPFEGGEISGFDFNPVADRLRLVGGNDQDLRINVDTGEVIEDGTLAFAEGDINSDANPDITAAAYTNSVADAESTELFDIDATLNSLVLQDPPNDGTLQTVGELGVDPDATAGFDIVSNTEGENAGFAVSSNSVLYQVDLETGETSGLGPINGETGLGAVQGLTAVDTPEADTTEVEAPPVTTQSNFALDEAEVVADTPVIDTAAEGNFNAVLNGNRLDVSGTFTDLTSDLLFVGGEDPAGNAESPIHLHIGEVGEAGGILRNLQVVDNGDNSGSFSGSFDLSPEDAALVEADSVYVNLHTEDNPDGELRGQIDLDGSLSADAAPDSPVIPEVAAESNFVALTENNVLATFNPNNLSDVETVEATGIEGDLVGIDTRPADGLIYGVSTENNVYTIDQNSGEATLVSTLDIPFEGGEISGFDFNSVADRLRLVGGNDQDLRINVDTGEVIEDGTLAFAEGDINSEANPDITAAAYTNSVADAESTELFDIDATLNSLVLQDPPNDGTLQTVGELGVDPDSTAGFDIVSDTEGENAAFAVSSNSVLYQVDLETGETSGLGAVGGDSGLGNVRGLTAVDAPEADAPEADAPEADAPEVDAPEADAPEVDAPEVDAPEVDAPEVDAPEVDAPEVDASEVDAPEVDAPDMMASSPENSEGESGLVDVTVTVENLSPENGTTLTPLWAGFHDGTFDTYDRGRPVSAGVESLAEDGDTSGLSSEFLQSGLGTVDGTILGEGGANPAEIDPGETTSITFSIDPNAADSRFFNYASMILPTNDTWIANGAPDAHEIFDEDGNFLGADIVVGGQDALDAGTEVNDELAANTAFFSQAAPNTGVTENGVVQEAEGFIRDGRILSSPDFANADYLQRDFEFARISVTAEGIGDSSNSDANDLESTNSLDSVFNTVNGDPSSFEALV